MADFNVQRMQSLGNTACAAEAAPYVAQGIVEYQLNPMIDPAAIPTIEKLLAGCPGTKGIGQATIDQLQDLKKQLTVGAKK